MGATAIQPLVRSCSNVLKQTQSCRYTTLQRGPAGRSSKPQIPPWGASGWGSLAGSGEVARMGQLAWGPRRVQARGTFLGDDSGRQSG